jgi:hypothetical protein
MWKHVAYCHGTPCLGPWGCAATWRTHGQWAGKGRGGIWSSEIPNHQKGANHLLGHQGGGGVRGDTRVQLISPARDLEWVNCYFHPQRLRSASHTTYIFCQKRPTRADPRLYAKGWVWRMLTTSLANVAHVMRSPHPSGNCRQRATRITNMAVKINRTHAHFWVQCGRSRGTRAVWGFVTVAAS